MLNIPLEAIPSQSLSIQLNNEYYDLRLHDCGNGVMTIDISVNDVVIVTGVRLVPYYPLLASYLELGNFILQTVDYEYPDWTRFGVDQYLIYANQTEIEAINAPTT